MAKEFLMQFAGMPLTVGQTLVFDFQGKKLLGLAVKTLEGKFKNNNKQSVFIFGTKFLFTKQDVFLFFFVNFCTNNDFHIIAVDPKSLGEGKETTTKNVRFGRILGNTIVQFEKAENSSLNLQGKSKGKIVRQSIINPDWDFGKMGIGGLDKEFNAIFRRAFASRVFPPELVEQLGCKHVKGILLYGPPGTGKTLMARQIGTMLNAREPKIVNGPQILDKYVGESEANIRRLFAEAEEEEKRVSRKNL